MRACQVRRDLIFLKLVHSAKANSLSHAAVKRLHVISLLMFICQSNERHSKLAYSGAASMQSMQGISFHDKVTTGKQRAHRWPRELSCRLVVQALCTAACRMRITKVVAASPRR